MGQCTQLQGVFPRTALFLHGALGALLLCLLTACGNANRIDIEWHKGNLVDGLLAHWMAVAPTESGFMRTAFDSQWKPREQQPGYLTEQCRLIYSMIIGYEVTKDKRYLDAANRGANFLLSRFHDPMHGGFFQRVAPDGKVILEGKNLYGHAFALLALSHMFRVTQEPRYRVAALQTWVDIDTGMRDAKGGFTGDLPRNFVRPTAGGNGSNSQNPLMHLFEALLALHDATQDPIAIQGAKGLADFVIYRLLTGTSDDGAYIPEWYDLDWKPLPTREKGGYTDLGHQFEWSHMLWAAEKRGLPAIYSLSGERILKFAIKHGYDEMDGGVFTRMYPDGTVDRDKFWWQQTEGLRTFLVVASANGQKDMWRRYDQTLDLVRSQFINAQNGGWYSRSRVQCLRSSCPDEQPEPYHMVGMHWTALHLSNVH